jgi:hypothetical protein
VRVEEGTSLYRAGEAPGPLLRNGAAITLWNLDPGGRDDGAAGFRQSHPWVLAVRSDGTSFGLLFDTTFRSRLDLTGDILFVTEGPPFPVLAIDRPSPGEVVEALADLTGKMPLPLWALLPPGGPPTLGRRPPGRARLPREEDPATRSDRRRVRRRRPIFHVSSDSLPDPLA